MSSKAAVAIAVLLVAAGAAAEPKNAPTPPAGSAASAPANASEDAVKARARALYERGVRAYADAKYYEAADLFVEANRVYPSPDLVFNIAKAYDKLGNPSAALAQYRDYLRQAGSVADESAVARAKELAAALGQRGVQQLSVLSDPESALVFIDGKAVGITPWTGETWPGKHQVILALAGHESFEATVDVVAHRADDLTVKLAPLPAPKAESLAARAAPQPAAPSSVSPLTWIALGVGTAAFGGALLVEMANHDRSGLTRTGAFLGGAGAAACALGGVLLYIDLSGVPRGQQGNASTQRAALGVVAPF